MKEDLIAIGEIVNTQGIKGELKVIPLTDFVNRFEGLTGAYIVKTDQIVATVDVEQYRLHKNVVILKLRGYDSINDVEKFKPSTIMIEKARLIKLPRGHYYIFEIVGLQVYTMVGEYLGEITEVIQGSNDIYVVQNKQSKSKELLIPAIKDVVKEINIADGKMLVELLEGLR